MFFSVDEGLDSQVKNNFPYPVLLARVGKSMNNALWDLLYYNKVNLHITDFGIHQLFCRVSIVMLCCQRLITFSHLFEHYFFRMKKAAGRCGLLCRIWRLARSSACIMYLALLLCQSHVNLCAVSIQELDARRAIIHSTAIMLCMIFSFKVLYCVTFCRKVFYEEVYIKRWLSYTCLNTLSDLYKLSILLCKWAWKLP